MKELASLLTRLDGKSYKAYKDLLGEHRFEGWTLIVDHVQADPFAAPSRVRARVDAATAQLPQTVFTSQARRCAARDYIARAFRQATRNEKELGIDAGNQTVLDRTATLIDDNGDVELRLNLSLPARGRSIMGHQARKLICEKLPEAVLAAATARRLDLEALERHMAVVEDQHALRRQLPEHGIVAFVANGSILPRRSGVDDRPLTDAIPFETPGSLAVTLETPNHGPVAGMGIPEGITLIVGGGFHGKSTLLSALGLGAYDHVPGDGREQVVTDGGAAKIRAEDGRAVHGLDLSPYINRLPYGKTTERFSTELASGSTSQAAALQESLEAGAHTLLVDEDTSATNFMIRDRRMQALVARESEPITPFVDRIRQLRDELSVSTILVMGGSGDYFDYADTVIQLQDYHAHDVTADARAVAERFATGRETEALDPLNRPAPRPLIGKQLNPETKPGKTKIQARGPDTLIFGRDDVDLRSVEQVADPSQVRAIGQLLARVAESGARLDQPPEELARRLEAGLTALSRRPDGDLALPRLHEVMAVLNRLRSSAFGDS
ncbi:MULTISPECIES: ABC-ATPase domain-containing protein [Halomonadaceae]|uniref:Isopentenyl-diphosphate delta-isomerase n=2 Tax=Bacteria TaxID=2 RepID=A0A9X5B5E8_9GAMM|nr:MULTISPECIES: ABC-ATPase domain-containing protein [Halomonas]MYL26112.1 isopentenyl-diphosphate delta-isomerase [Halomonas utahensis]MYL73326.1 isopentenyl-diphosphate delta-isomerase [Halomonas sp. 22501_18_FS]